MANHVSHAALPYPVKGARFTLEVPYLDNSGTPADPSTPDTEVSLDGGAFADCAEEVTTVTGSNGMGYVTLTGAETNASMVMVAAKTAGTAKPTLLLVYPRVLPIVFTGTASAGAASTLTLATDVPPVLDLLKGCILRTTGGTGGGGTGGANNQARVITAFTTGRVATVEPNWETTPDATTTYDVLLTESALLRYADVRLFASQASVDAIQADTDDLQTRVPAALVGGRMDSNVGGMAANVITTTSIANAALTNAKFNNDLGQLKNMVTATAGGGSASTLQGAGTESSTDNLYTGALIAIITGTGAGQAPRLITAYNGTTKVFTVTPDWVVIPSVDSLFVVHRTGGPANVVAMVPNVLTASALAADAVDEILDDQIGDGTITMRQALRVLIAGMAGKLSGAATTTITIRNLADSANVVVATVDASGNRSAVSVTP